MSATDRLGWLGSAQCRAGTVDVRRLRRSDGPAWSAIRLRDEAELSPWEVSSPVPWAARHSRGQWRLHLRRLRVAQARGESVGCGIEIDGQFVGQVSFGGIHLGGMRSGWVGYWVDSQWHRLGVASTAVAIAVDAAFAGRGPFGAPPFGGEGLHRVEATIAPANLASRRVVERLGFRHEGVLQRYLNVAGRWQDHLLYAITAEEVPGGLVARLT